MLEANRLDKSAESNKPIVIMYLIDTSIHAPNAPRSGGAEKQLYLLASSLNPAQFKPIVIELKPDIPSPIKPDDLGGITRLHFPIRKLTRLSSLGQIVRLSRLAEAERVDIIHTFFEKSEVVGWLTARLAGLPVWITSRRDLGFKRKRAYNWISFFAARDCQRYVAVCEAVKNRLVQHDGIFSEKVEVIYNAVDCAPYHPAADSKTLKNELPLDEGVPLVGMVADFKFEIKGHRYFLMAAKSVLEKIPEVRFLLVGDGPLRRKYEEMARALKVDRKVFFLGRRADVPAILSTLTVSVLSSTSEGLSNVLLESMAAGRPVVATRVGGNSEIVLEGTTGYLVPPEDSEALAGAITKLVRNPEKAAQMGAAGKKRVAEAFTLEAMVMNHERLYRSLMR